MITCPARFMVMAGNEKQSLEQIDDHGVAATRAE
jgi:hypothetical protein